MMGYKQLKKESQNMFEVTEGKCDDVIVLIRVN